ncbi:MAG TPA: hypothetical protein VIL28_15905 [Steroidobacteraceae bacterium]
MKQQTDDVVITGASGSIDRTTAREFARPGAKLALLARDGGKQWRLTKHRALIAGCFAALFGIGGLAALALRE